MKKEQAKVTQAGVGYRRILDVKWNYYTYFDIQLNPFSSPTRKGVENIMLGLVLSQQQETRIFHCFKKYLAYYTFKMVFLGLINVFFSFGKAKG